MTAEAVWAASLLCETCGKRSYWSRRDARRARRAHHPGEKGLQAYECPAHQGYHLGHRDPDRVASANLNDPRIRLLPDAERTGSAAEAMAKMAQLGRLPGTVRPAPCELPNGALSE